MHGEFKGVFFYGVGAMMFVIGEVNSVFSFQCLSASGVVVAPASTVELSSMGGKWDQIRVE